MAIGRPIELTPNITSKNISIAATEGQTEFTVTGGYRINELSVYRNGVRLVDGRDFSATDGQTVTFISDTVVADDIVEFSVLDNFDVAGVIVGAASTQTLSGNLHVTGEFYAGDFNPTNLVSTAGTITRITNTNLVATAGTFNSAFHVGSALTSNGSGDVETIGIITAASFSGDGSALTGVANTAYVVSVATTTGNLNVSAAATITGAIDANATTDSTSSTTGAITAAGGVGIAKDLFVGDSIDVTKDLKVGAAVTITGALSASTISGTTGTFSGAVNVDATTDSTSSTTGALIVDGGLGVAKNVYIGAGLSVAGTLTYEDVTNVDSVGMVTAKSGVNVSGGELNVGLGFSVGNAGIITSTGGIIDLKNSGSVSNIKFYCESSNAHYTALQSAAHSAYSGNVTLTLPTTTDTLIGRTTTDTLTNKTLTSPVVDGEFKVGTAVTIASTSGVSTFSRAVTFKDANVTFSADNYDITFVHDANCVRWGDNAQAQFGTDQDLRLYHDGSHAYLNETTGQIKLRLDGNDRIVINNTGTVTTGITTANGATFDCTVGPLKEKVKITAGKLSDNTAIDLYDGMVHYFTTQETTTSTPVIRYRNSTNTALNHVMSIGDCITVTVITTAAAAGYSANWAIDGNNVTEEWVGGSAPSAGGSDGLDIYSLTIIKTADATFKVIANLSNAT